MSKKKKNKEYNQQIIVRWVIPVLILIVVLVVLVSKFGVESETNARTSVNRKLNKGQLEGLCAQHLQQCARHISRCFG